MDTNKKKTKKRIVFAAVALLLVASLVTLPFVLDARQQAGSKASVLSARAETGQIQKMLSGTGTITEQEAAEVSVPQGVKVTEYLVENGQFVKKGDPVARVDKISVMTTISSVQEAMAEVTDEMESLNSSTSLSYVSAPADGIVKAVYASAGDSVQQVILEHGSLAVLSLDGMMAVRLPASEGLAIGQAVRVILSDGKEVPGRVESVYDAVATVTISDRYGDIDEPVQVLDEAGLSLGSGSLYVHSAWKAMATGGTVSNVFASVGLGYYSGGAMLSIVEGKGSESYESLAAEYRRYEEVMEKLFLLYQDGALLAPCDGCVSGADRSILKQLSAAGGVSLRLLANAPGDDPDGSFSNRVGMITAVKEDGSVASKMLAWDTEIPDDTDLSYIYTAADSMTQEVSFTPPMIFSWDGETWTEGGSIEPGDVFVFAYGSDLVWMIPVGHNELSEPEKPTPSPQPQVPGDEGGDTPQMPTGGSMGDMNMGTLAGTQEVKDRYSAVETTILSVTPYETVTVSITIDELDILSVRAGQEAAVTLDALPGQAFTGLITQVDTTPSNDGGHSKYSATVELDRTGMMLGGMNATASITVESLEDVLLIPAAALTEQDGQSMVYTAYDSRTDTLSGLRAVEIGLSDGEQVQILSGLSEGETVWYEYFDTLT